MTLGALAIAVGLVAAAILRIAQLLRPRTAAEPRAVLHRLADVEPVGAALGNTAMVELHGDFETGWTCVSWTDGPVGGANLVDRFAQDPTGGRLLTGA